MNYTVQSGQSVSDVVMATYGDLSYLYQLIQDNPILISANTIPNSGTIVTWNTALVALPQPLEVTTMPVVIPTIQTYLSKSGQSIYDICMQLYGTMELLYKLIQDNNYISVLALPISNTPFKFDVTLQTDTDFFKYLSSTKKQINTASVSNYIVYSNEDETVIYTSEDGSVIYTPEG